jgi:hypothetical protein
LALSFLNILSWQTFGFAVPLYDVPEIGNSSDFTILLLESISYSAINTIDHTMNWRHMLTRKR